MTVKLLHGACELVLPTFESESIDACVTDPPYGLKFMGKKWDAQVPTVEQWREVWRVLKPGGYLLAFGGTRTYHRMVCAIEDAGFEIRDQLAWIFGSGFPKSLDVSKAIDKARNDRPDILRVTTFMLDAAERAGITRAAVDTAMGTSDMGGWWLSRLEHRCQCPQWDQWLQLKALLCMSDEMDSEVWRLNGRKGTPGNYRLDREVSEPGENSVFQPTQRVINPGAPILDAARRWEGWGTALKPAHEPIVLARKPLDGTVAENVQAHGTGAINIAGCRVDGDARPARDARNYRELSSNGIYGDGLNGSRAIGETTLGRWPANVLHDGSDEVIAAFPEAAGQMADVTGDEPTARGFTGAVFNEMPARARALARARVEGDLSAARFFYCAKASREDREDGLAHLSKRPLLWSSGTQSPGTFQSEGTDRSARNNHPTVKPTELMRYLCRLITPPGGTVLDPFMGSGSTGRGAFLEGFSFVGIEKDEKWIAIAEARIRAISPLFFEAIA